MHFREFHSRSFAKAVSFRAIILVSDFVLVYAITRQYDVTFSVMFATNAASTLLYYLHERAWNGIHWGKHVSS